MTAIGPFTGVSLSDISMLFLRPASAEGHSDGAPNHSRQALQLSFELAAAAYTMDPDCWTQAGWRDFSMLVNRSLLTGSAMNSAGTPLNDLTRTTLQTLARLKMSALNPIEQVMGLRQPGDETSSLKAIVMLKPHAGLMTVAIGFMGTGKQLGDWTPNLRMTPRDGLHGGFLQLAQEFTERLPQIEFPYGAFRLNQDSLSLAGIIETLKKPGSPFRLWVCGHSQGAAVMQVFIDRLLREGVRAEYLTGIGFASPSVAYPDHPMQAGGYPITHVINEDDMVPRVGAWQHLGEYLVFTPNEADRHVMYGAAAVDPCFREAHRLLRRAETAPEALLNGIAILRVMRQQSEQSLQRVLGEAEQHPVAELLNAGEGSLLKLVDSLSARLESGYIAVSGEASVPEKQLSDLISVWSGLLNRYGVAVWTRSIRDAAMLPHRMYRGTEGMIPSYRYIVTEGWTRLKPLGGLMPDLTVLSSGTAEMRASLRTVNQDWAAGHTYRRAALRLPGDQENAAVTEKKITGNPFAVVPAAPQPIRAGAKVITHVSRYASAIRLLAASRAKKKKS